MFPLLSCIWKISFTEQVVFSELWAIALFQTQPFSKHSYVPGSLLETSYVLSHLILATIDSTPILQQEKQLRGFQ